MGNQRIFLTEEDELVIITDNGKQTKDKTEVGLHGTFEVSAKDVARLFGLINKKTLLYCSSLKIDAPYSLYPQCRELLCIIDAKENGVLQKISDKLSAKEKDLARLNMIHEGLIRENNDLKNKVKEYNKNRHWWERELKIEED